MSHKAWKDEFKVRISILHKMVLYATLLIFIAVGVSTYLAVKTESKALTQGLIHTGKHMARDIASGTESAFWSLNWIFVEKMLRESGQYSPNEVIYAKIVKPDGEVYLANDKAHYGGMIDSSLLFDHETLVDNYFFPEAKVHGYLLVRPIKIGNDRWYVIVGLSLESVNVAIRGLIVRNLGFGGLIVLLGIIGSFFLSRSISRPIVRLAEVAKGISSGHWHSVDIKSKDEVGLLSHSFNTMVNNLRRAEEELKRYAAELKRSNQELQQFAYVASHDLQEPLRMVASYTQLLAKRYKGKLGSDADEFIGYAVDGATHMQALINDLLDYSRVGRKGKDFEPTDCTALLERTLDNLRKAVEESSAKVTHDPLPTVMADDVQLGQLFQNLIGNALKFRSKEPPHIHISAQQKGDKWLFSVRDNGIGIDPGFSERIFTIFQRLHKRGDYPGTGIGLAICKKIVERHGGSIWVKSKPEKGSTFYFTIPAREGDSHEQQSDG